MELRTVSNGSSDIWVLNLQFLLVMLINKGVSLVGGLQSLFRVNGITAICMPQFHDGEY